MLNNLLFVCCGLALLLTTGCSYHEVYESPSVTLPNLQPLSEANQLTFGDSPVAHWWELYQSPELNLLLQQLKNTNLDLLSARKRVQQSQYLLGQQLANNWPSLDGSLSHRANRDQYDDHTNNSSNLSLTARYDVDLWGSRSAANTQAHLGVLSRTLELRNLQLDLLASFSQAYFNYLALLERIEIAQQNVQTSRELLNIIQLRFEAGSASGIEVNQQRNTLLSAQAALLNIQRASITQQRVLAVLLGDESLQLRHPISEFERLILPEIKLVQPATILEQRPDIQQAETQLRMQNAVLFQQKQKRWPGLSLSAGLNLDDIFSGSEYWSSSLIGSLVMPIIDAGNIRNQIDAAQVEVTIAQLSYKKIVLLAMQQTIESLTELQYQRDLLNVRKEEFANNQRLYELAKVRYESGDTDFLNLLTAQRAWFSARDGLIQAKYAQLLATVEVFRALGY